MTLGLIELRQCPVCHHNERDKLFEIPGSSVYECLHCRLRYLDPCLSPSAMASAYESTETLKKMHAFHQNYYDYGDLTKPSKTREDFTKALALLERHIPIPAEMKRNVLDVGYGNGFFLALAKNQGWAIDGIDTSPANAELSKKKFNLDLRIGRLEGTIVEKEIYDVVSFWDVLEHFHEPYSILQTTSKILKPSGIVLVAVPNDKSLLAYISSCLYRMSFGHFRMGIEQIYFQEHVCYYNLSSLCELFSRNGFSLLDFFYSSTDLEKYYFPEHRKIIAKIILRMGQWLRLENRLVALFKKNSSPQR